MKNAVGSSHPPSSCLQEERAERELRKAEMQVWHLSYREV